MQGIYRKLEKGEIVDQNIVNTIIVGGLMSFLAQKEVNQKWEAKVTDLETELKTSNYRIEALENWINKNKENMNICRI